MMKKRWILWSVILICGILAFVAMGVNKYKQTQFSDKVEPEKFGLSLDIVEIKIEDMEGDYIFLFMADNQADFGTRDDLGWFGSADTRRFGDENGVSSADNMANWIAYANESQVDALILGGDIIDFFSEENIEALQNNIEELEVPYQYTYGNHDSYIPWVNLFDDDNENFLKLFQNNNCEFQVMDMGEFYVVSLRNYQTDGTAQVSREALEGYRSISTAGKPIILVCHVPIYTDNAEGLKEMVESVYGDVFLEYDAGEFGTVDESLLLGEDCGYTLTVETQEFMQEILMPDSPVIAVLAGHLHTNWQGVLNDRINEYVTDPAYLNRGILIHVYGNN